MIVAAINKTIQEMCEEVEATSTPLHTDWQSFTEEQLLHEAAICVFSSQMVFEVAVAAANRMFELSLFNWDVLKRLSNYENAFLSALNDPLSVEINGEKRRMMPRFKNRWASLLSATINEIHNCGSSIYNLLLSANSAHEAREVLVERVWGFGPKQASLYLRRIGYCSELAVLDTHVLDYLQLALGTAPKPSALSRLQTYERVEDEFRQIAKEFGYSVGCVDLATWITMRVAKREAWL